MQHTSSSSAAVRRSACTARCDLRCALPFDYHTLSLKIKSCAHLVALLKTCRKLHGCLHSLKVIHRERIVANPREELRLDRDGDVDDAILILRAQRGVELMCRCVAKQKMK